MPTPSSTLGSNDLRDIASLPVPNKAPAAAVARFARMRYGLFIHFGLYSLIGRHEWAMCYERIPPEEYRKLANRFNPTNLDVSDWVRQAKDWGMRYICFTTRHHDGFALFDSQVSSFNAVRSPLGRDLVREYVNACREAGLGVGLYYSIADWGDPGFIAGPGKDPVGWEKFVDVAHRQLEELMTHYGKIDYLFYLAGR
jgi:alpha-L-fucosidase